MALELHERFHAMKTYGKEPESLKSIVKIFLKDLAAYPLDKILKAITLHAQRSQEFPTVADIVGLIKRGGRAPITKEVYIAISKKDGELRTPEEWKTLREYEAEQIQEEFGRDEPRVDTGENERLRQRIKELETEYARLAEVLHQTKMAKGLERPKPSAQEKIDNTVAEMRRMGASEEDVEQFIRECGVAA